MKQKFLIIALFTVGFAACYKKPGDPSTIAVTSFPTVTPAASFTGYFSVPLNGALPTPDMVGTAYDSTLKAACTITMLDTNVHVNVAGMYSATAVATNQNGFAQYYFVNQNPISFYIAVTNLPSGTPNLAGVWKIGTTDSLNDTLTAIGNGFYSCNNFNAANLIANPGKGTTATFAVINNSTIAFADANFGSGGILRMLPGDTTISYPDAAGDTIVYIKR
jgi:hypothetical protein